MQPPSDRGHPMPRRATPEKSITLQHHRLAREATRKSSLLKAPAVPSASSPRRNSSGESLDTRNSDPKRWFDRSNNNGTTAYDANTMDVDPPFFQKETDSSNEESRATGAAFRNPAHAYSQGPHQAGFLRRTQSSSADDYRSVIDDLTIENKRLKEELKRYKQFGPDIMRKDKLFEIKVHGLPQRKKRELEATLRDFAVGLEGSSEPPSQRRKVGNHGSNMYYSGESISKHASSSSSHSRPVDSAYASMSIGTGSNGPQSSGPSLGRPALSRGKSSAEQNVQSYLRDTPDGLFPRHVVMSDKERKKLVVRRLEHLFTGKIGGRSPHRSQRLSSLDVKALVDAPAMAPPRNPEAAREACIQPQDPLQKKPRSRDNLSTNSNGDQTESGGNGMGSGDGNGSGGRNGPHASPPAAALPEQRPTRPRDLDPDRVQIPSENMDYIRHLGLVTQEFLVGEKANYQNVSPDADGWVYLNLLCNLAQLHIINVTPSFIRSAVTEKSKKFQLSPDGRKIRWRGGTDGTKFSSDSGENSLKSPSTEESDSNKEDGQRKKQKTQSMAGQMLSGSPSSESKFKPLASNSGESFHYKPLFVHRSSSSIESSLEGTGSPGSGGGGDESNPGNAGYSQWNYSGTGSRKHRRDGAIVYYSGAPFCTDLSGDPGDISPTTYMTSTGRELESIQTAPRHLMHRTSSGSSLAIRPLSDPRAIVSEALDMDLDNLPDLMVNDEDSTNDEDIEFPWCEETDSAGPGEAVPVLDPCGLGGVLPEDHFAVVVTTRRPIVRDRADRSVTEDIAEVVARRLALIRASSPGPQRCAVAMDRPIRIDYLATRFKQLMPVILPPPGIFFPPFSTDDDSDDDSDETDSEDMDDFSENSSSGELISLRANPHHSVKNFAENEDVQSSHEADNAEGRYASNRCHLFVREEEPATGSTDVPGKDEHLPRTGSSVATAGGAESGYSSSMEDDAL
ncbi:frequency clock protein [Podospora appendiculata]|uniref:Frequency clock protein n=1 Tax=Podospora appendiculata TaxID=314037 RepID=A0AAE1CDH0_9PEZI|nr:frequency clock protein [Podospora appendiculata]